MPNHSPEARLSSEANLNQTTRFRIILVSIHVEKGPEAVPLGAACVAAALRADPETAAAFDLSLLETTAAEDPRVLADRLVAEKPDLVGFSIYLWNREVSTAAARRVRALLGESVLFAGGADATARPVGLVAEEGGPFDFVVLGEGETATVAALRSLIRGGDFSGIRGVHTGAEAAPRRAPLEDAGLLPSPWLTPTLSPAGRAGVLWELARGCPYACTYCYESKGERRVRYFAEDRVTAELELFAREAVPSVTVLDPTFNADKERARRLLSLIAEKAPASHWHFEIRAESLDRDLARRFAELGASLQVGLQTGRPEIAAKVGRKLDRGQFASKIALLNEEGAVFGLDLIYGLPDDDLAGYSASLDFALSLYPNNLDLFRLSVLPGTAMADDAEVLGLTADEEAPYLIRSTPTFGAADLSVAERLSAAVDLFYNKGRAVAWFNQVLNPLGDKGARFLAGFADFLDQKLQAAKPLRRPGGQDGKVAGKAGTPGTAHGEWGRLMDPSDPVALERLQLAYLDARFEEAELDYLLPAVWDVVRFHGAWARAIADCMATDIDFTYDPDDVLGPGAMDLEDFAALAHPRPCHVRVIPGEDEPIVRIS